MARVIGNTTALSVSSTDKYCLGVDLTETAEILLCFCPPSVEPTKVQILTTH